MFGGIASKGLRAIHYQVTRKVEASRNPSNTTETLIAIAFVVHWPFNQLFSCE